jgi:hypothetical protein
MVRRLQQPCAAVSGCSCRGDYDKDKEAQGRCGARRGLMTVVHAM